MTGNYRIPYALRRGRQKTLSNGLRPNTLMGVRWRFLNESSPCHKPSSSSPAMESLDIEWQQREEIANEFEKKFPLQDRSFVSVLEEHSRKMETTDAIFEDDSDEDKSNSEASESEFEDTDDEFDEDELKHLEESYERENEFSQELESVESDEDGTSFTFTTSSC